MLVLKRKEGQWVEITHRSGDTIRVRVYNIRARYPGQLDLAFDDTELNFQIQRPVRTAKLLGVGRTPSSAAAAPPRLGLAVPARARAASAIAPARSRTRAH